MPITSRRYRLLEYQPEAGLRVWRKNMPISLVTDEDGGFYPLPSYEDLASFRTGSYALPELRSLDVFPDGLVVIVFACEERWRWVVKVAKIKTEGRSEVVKVGRENAANKGGLVKLSE